MIINKVIDRKVVNKKLFNLVKVLKKKTDALYIKFQLREIGLRSKVEAQSMEI